MKLSAAGLELLKKAEGFRSKAYKDIAGRATIGYGHRIGPNDVFPSEITEEKAEAILQWDIHEAEDAVTRLVKVPLSQGQFDALVDFTFNLGATRLRDSTLLEVLNDGNYDAAGRQFLRWDRGPGGPPPSRHSATAKESFADPRILPARGGAIIVGSPAQQNWKCAISPVSPSHLWSAAYQL